MGKAEASERIDFLPGVSTTVWKRAGGLCSIRDCLRSVFASDGNLDPDCGPHKATMIGEAAHIYSAREKWSRGRGGKPPEFIASAENGISTCRNCHRNVDIVESRYSAESLFEMKRVREKSQDITRHNPVVSFYVSEIGPRRLDELVWEASDREDEKGIAEAFIIFAEAAVLALRRIKDSLCRQMPIPVGMDPLPIVNAINRVHQPEEFVFDPDPLGPIQHLQFGDLKQAEGDQIARTLELAESWSCGLDNILVHDTVRCEVFTRDLITGTPGEVFKFNVLAGVLKNTDPEFGEQAVLKVTQFEHHSVGFSWELEAVLNQNGHTLQSSLKLDRLACPDNTRDFQEFKVFAGYARVLKEIESGRLPYARLSTLNSMARYEESTPWDEDRMHPLEFPLNVVESSERIREVVAFNDKALLGYRISHELDAPIVYRRDTGTRMYVIDADNGYLQGFFDHRLTEQLIREAIHEVRATASLGLTKTYGAVSGPLVEFQRFERPYVIRAYHDIFNTAFKLEAVPEPRRAN
ncbi:hypothetical protein [Pseudomonas sp. P9(2020)]|uniref:hypothetical protein n=1 Tax=Pseudomonas sp. P9(2020) TaxID=2763316 RepID=UPI001B322547|nr:hypothetical protein [Pseudomonas sp. P9(2020)]MBP5947850.1 hypothetical protein [Pseudomonas sp. P9(2020)]